jgi:2-desacetyl-2-hydroxyethyl bacteriochlorophyllide A dehydrogenase
MRAAAWTAPQRIALVDREDPVAGSGQAVVEVATCGICGSDLHSFREGLSVEPGGVLGHEFSGRVVAAPEVEGVRVGDRVAVRPLIPCGDCDRCAAGDLQLCEGSHEHDIGYASPGALAERVLVPRAVLGETLFALPEDVDDAAGALVEPMAVALHAVAAAEVESSGVALVLGAGTIGLGVIRFLNLAAATRIVVAEPARRRRDRALELGAEIGINPATEDVTDTMRCLTGPGPYGLGARVDVVFECSGSPAALAAALKCARPGGTVVLGGIYGRAIPARLDIVVTKELRLRGTAAYADEFPTVISHLSAGTLRAEEFVSHTFSLDDVDSAFRTQMDPEQSLKVQVRPGPPVIT